ncbi:hypothetical protein CAFE_17910 [Caprobacter fermentans]|uniref:Uncharacterized protein n=1 Tax=Caproicibacter fermentans TaxID=2576756 RepID=A0A6N8HZF8_9FIRM|nr:hypothetical protein [Caproicibacter fermentans]MVB11089.1 hypothetical protein [Caproicibacter fermentans]
MPYLFSPDGGVNRKIKKLYAPDGGISRKVKSLWAPDQGINRKIFQGFHATGTITSTHASPAHSSGSWGTDGSLSMEIHNWGDYQSSASVTADLIFDDPIPLGGDNDTILTIINVDWSMNGFVTGSIRYVQGYDDIGHGIFYVSEDVGSYLDTGSTQSFSNYQQRTNMKKLRFYLYGRMDEDADLSCSIPAGGIIVGDIDQYTVDNVAI